MPAPRTKTPRNGLTPIMTGFRAKRKLATASAAVAAGVSIETWRCAELYSIASDETLEKLAAIGVDLAGIGPRPSRASHRRTP